jgi:hypothetical protein
MDRLEEHIRENREELDKYSLSPDVWKGIAKALHKSRTEIMRWFSAAAMIIVIFSTAALFYVAEYKRNYGYGNDNTDAMLMKAAPQLKETEIYYNNIVNNLYTEATPLLTEYPDVEKELINDLSQLDSICADIRQDLKDNVSNQAVIEALINNYRTKIHVLEDMLEILRQNENTKEENDDHAL